MVYRFHHLHLKSPDPGKTAQWWVRAFNFKIVGDDVRPTGDRFIRCTSEDGGTAINITGPRKGETPGPGDASIHYGLEHFGLASADVDADVKRLVGMGAKLLEGPTVTPAGLKIAFLAGPDDVRFELIEPKRE